MNIYGLDFNLIKALHALIERQNVSQAAQKIGLSQPAMSAALNRLRAVIDDPILVQTGRRMIATPKAQRLFPVAARILNDMEAILHNQDKFDPRTATREYIITTTDIVTVTFLPKILNVFEREAPGCQLTIRTFHSDSAWADLENGSSDFAIGVWRAEELSAAVVSAKLLDEDFLCAVRKNHPVLKSKLNLKKFVELKHLLVSPSSRGEGVVDVLLREKGLQRKIVVRTPNFMSAPVLLSQTDYITTLPRTLLEQFQKTYGLTLLEPPLKIPSFEYKLGWAKRFEAEPSQIWLRELLIKTLRSP